MSDEVQIPGWMVEGNTRLREMGILDWIYCAKAENPVEYEHGRHSLYQRSKECTTQKGSSVIRKPRGRLSSVGKG